MAAGKKSEGSASKATIHTTDLEPTPSLLSRHKDKLIMAGLGLTVLTLFSTLIFRSSALTNQFIPLSLTSSTNTTGSVQPVPDATAAGGSYLKFVAAGQDPSPEPPPQPPSAGDCTPDGSTSYVPPSGYPFYQNGTYYSTLGVPSACLPWKFASQLIWNQPLPDSTPVASDSGAIVSQLASLAGPGGPYGGATFETRQYAPAMFIVDSAAVPLRYISQVPGQAWPGYDLEGHLNSGYQGGSGVPMPSGVNVSMANAGTDAPMAIYDWRTDTQFNFWVFDSNSMTTWWGGRLSNYSTHTGNPNNERPSPAGTFPFPYGEDFAGFPDLGTNITMDDIASGSIDHVIAISTPSACGTGALGDYSYPATRSGGGGCGGGKLIGGQRLRLPANYDTSGISNPVIRMIAEAAKKYGLINHDYGGAVSFQFEGDLSVTEMGRPSPWGSLLAGANAQQFPWGDLQALPIDWGKP